MRRWISRQWKRRPHVWRLIEIRGLPEFGGEVGWFYGLVRDEDGRIRLAEILPGMGWTHPWCRDLWRVDRVLGDLLRCRPPRYVGWHNATNATTASIWVGNTATTATSIDIGGGT